MPKSSFTTFGEPSSKPSGFAYGRSAKGVPTPFGYFGSKHRLAGRIASMLPPHNHWIEAFCGSAAVTFAKEPCARECINDLDGAAINVFTQLRDVPDQLLRMVTLTPYARSEYELAKTAVEGETPLERARRYLVNAMMTVNGSAGSAHAGFSFSDSYTRGGVEARVNRWLKLPQRLELVAQRLKGIELLQLDAIDVLDAHAHEPQTLVYLDPPYLMDRRHGYRVDANDMDFHERLLTAARHARCMVLVSGYSNPLYTKLLTPSDGWLSTSLRTTTRGTSGVDSARTEMLWMNSAFVAAKQSPHDSTQQQMAKGLISSESIQ